MQKKKWIKYCEILKLKNHNNNIYVFQGYNKQTKKIKYLKNEINDEKKKCICGLV